MGGLQRPFARCVLFAAVQLRRGRFDGPHRLDAAGREALSHSLFTLEAHIHYLREVKLGAALEVRAQVVAIDAKRLHVALALHVPGVDGAAALGEQMLLNMDMRGPRSAPFAPAVLARLQPLAAQHATLPRPARLGSVIGMPPKK